MALVTVKAKAGSEPKSCASPTFSAARVVDVSPTTYTLELTRAIHEKLGAVLSLLKVHGILDVVRSGALAIQRAKKD